MLYKKKKRINKYNNNINTISNKLKLKITKIGSITSKGYKYIKDGKAYKVKTKGYDHFSNR